MPTQQQLLTPQMEAYDDLVRQRRYTPYLMYLHPPDHRSPVVNTDSKGFRISHGVGISGSVTSARSLGGVRLVAGASIGFGIGATSDAQTIPSRLWSHYAPSAPWLNLTGVMYNPTQELLLMLLYRHLLPAVEEVVLLSGFNALRLARLPQWQHGEHGAFFLCGEYYQWVAQRQPPDRNRPTRRFRLRGRGTVAADARSVDDLIGAAVDITSRQLDNWQQLLAGTGARLTYVLHPLATWLRETPAPEEQRLFEAQDRRAPSGSWQERFGAISSMPVGNAYAQALEAACARQAVGFVNLAPLLRAATTDRDWLYVDRDHLTDKGYDIVSRIIAEQLKLS